MNPAIPRRTWLLGALLLGALVPAARAGDADSGGAGRSASSIERLKSDIGSPDGFQRYIEGSRARQGGPDDPRFDEARSARGPESAFRLSSGRPAPRLESSVPLAEPGVPAPRASSAPRREPFYVRVARSPLPLRKLSAVLGLGFMLIAASMLETPVERGPEPEPEPFPEAPRPAAPAPFAAPEPELAPSRLADALADRVFVDTRMPAPTWRAISLPEQELIDRWDASREKSLGLASLSDWLGVHGGGSGVDVALLQAKLRREA